MKNNKTKKLRFALPKGSLNTSSRWSTEALLKEAGFDIKGYKPDNRSYAPAIINDPELETIVDRPQNMPADLRDGIVDLAILGRDIAEEWRLAGVNLIELLDLEYGFTDLVMAVRDDMDVDDLSSFLKWMNFSVGSGEIIRCVSEYPLITQDRISKNEDYRNLLGNLPPNVITKYGFFGYNFNSDGKFGSVVEGNDKLIIIESNGATEAAIKKGAADIIVESSATGKTLAENDLKPIETLLKSSAGLYTTEDVLKDAWKVDKMGFVKTMLEGAVKARRTDYIVFNVVREKEEQMIKYLQEEKLFAKEPTVIRGGGYVQIGIEVGKSRWLSIAYGLKKRGAEDIMRTNPTQIID